MVTLVTYVWASVLPAYATTDSILKAQLVSRIDEIICDTKLTQIQAADIMGISQPDVSRLLKGQFRDVSVERIMRMLTRLGCKVDIVIKKPGHKAASTIHLQSARRFKVPIGARVRRKEKLKHL